MKTTQIVLTVIAAMAGGALTQWLFNPADVRAQDTQKAVRAESFELVDDSGRVRMRMDVENDAARLRMFDSDDHAVLALSVQKSGEASVSFHDTKGKQRAGVATGQDGAPILSMNYSSGRIANLLTVQGDNDAVFIANDPKGESLAAFGNSGGRPSVLFMDDKGRERVKLELKDDHSPAFAMKDAGGKSRLVAGVDAGGWSGVGVMDTSETVRSMIFSDGDEHGVTVAGADGKTRGSFTMGEGGDTYLTTRDKNGNQTARVPR